MTETIDNARALLRMFEQSDWQDMHIRAGDYSLFVARQRGGENPMRALRVIAAKRDQSVVTAPHVANLVSALPVGSTVQSGMMVAQIELLGDLIDVEADRDGVVETVFAEAGQLLEYGTPILRIISSH
jgi:acetyl-CoA carboxylase biotin carboxyl carrier protein